MVLQVEYFADLFIAIHPKFDIIFLFNHSCGHDRGREDGLNVRKMGSGYGGLSHLTMYPTKIKQEAGYLGPHPRKVK